MPLSSSSPSPSSSSPPPPPPLPPPSSCPGSYTKLGIARLKVSSPSTRNSSQCLVLSGPGSRSSSTSSLSSIASGAPPTPTSPRRRLASEPLDNTTKTPLRDQQQANNQVNSGTISSSSAANKLQPLRKNGLPGKFGRLLFYIHVLSLHSSLCVFFFECERL